MTVQEFLVSQVRSAAAFNRNDISPPRVVLWPDVERQWEPVMPVLRKVLPELLVLDPTEITTSGGPSTYLRYRISRMQAIVPIVYLPGVSRQAFRSASFFPSIARHLFPLQFQGQFWTQSNGKDWTPSAFLSSSDGGMSLDLARDTATQTALSAQLAQVLDTPIEHIHNQRITSELLYGMAAQDPVRMLLQWMASDGRLQDTWSKTSQWQAFTAIIKRQFKIDPAKDGVVTAAAHLLKGTLDWEIVWQRYIESPSVYPELRKVLGRVQPQGFFPEGNERMPAYNSGQEEVLRLGLLALGNLPPAEARDQLSMLVETHDMRAGWVWAQLGEAPLACATVHLGRMLEAMSLGLDATSWTTFAESYLEHGWKVDTEACKAYAAIHYAADAAGAGISITAALRAVYLPWMEDVATRGQRISNSYPKQTVADAIQFSPKPGSLLLFVDGLRADLCVALATMLHEESILVEREVAWSALPTVTATAKPAWYPMTQHVHVAEIGEGFEPLDSNGKPFRTREFKTALKHLGWTYLEPRETGDPASSAWTEAGTFDSYGHEQGAKLAWRLREELLAIKQRVLELFSAGWSEIHLFTDHGWLWMPGGLPKANLPKHLTVSKWGRCAVPQEGALHDLPQTGWFWGPQHTVVLAPNVCVFRNGIEYAHGGLSVQEALTPVLHLSRPGGNSRGVSISSHKWVGMRLHVTLTGDLSDVTADIRLKPADSTTSILAAIKTPDAQGNLSITVADDSQEGVAAVLVLLKGSTLLTKLPITIAEN